MWCQLPPTLVNPGNALSIDSAAEADNHAWGHEEESRSQVWQLASILQVEAKQCFFTRNVRGGWDKPQHTKWAKIRHEVYPNFEITFPNSFTKIIILPSRDIGVLRGKALPHFALHYHFTMNGQGFIWGRRSPLDTLS